jgi:hypothetical protein
MRRSSKSIGRPPRLIVVVDTEHEFDWSASFDRTKSGVGHMCYLNRVQSLCERWHIRPVYVIDYPVASQDSALAVLRPLLQQDRAMVGAHLHPWVSPPFEEELNSHNSFPGNLPPALERAKLSGLCERIVAGLGEQPRIYKAGRYGIGSDSFAILEELGFAVDLSPSPPFDYRAAGGPDFSHRGLAPEWVGPHRSVLSIPGTGALIGWIPSVRLYRLATDARLARLRLPAIFARLGILERMRLSPEGQSAADMQRLVRWLQGRGQDLFVLSLHSPSVEPGHTSYVRSESDLANFLAALEGFLHFFMTTFGGVATDPLAVRAELMARHGA